MFQFPRFPLPVLCVQTGVTPHDGCRVSPSFYPRIKAWSAAPRGFSQPPTSFIGVRRQGIHRWLFVAWKNKDARARYAVLKELGMRHERVVAPNMRTPAQPREWSDQRRLEDKRWRHHSLKTEDRTVRPNRARSSGGKTFDRRGRLEQTERGSNWESSLRVQEH